MKRLLAWWGRRFNVTAPAPVPSAPHHSIACVWDEEAFYGMAERLYGDK